MELFTEVYGCYYHVIAQILEQAKSTGISKEAIEAIVEEQAFYDSTFHLLPNLFSNKWQFLEKKDNLYFSKLTSSNTSRPLTKLEKSWLKALLHDERIALFIDAPEREQVLALLTDIPPLFEPSYFHVFDSALDKDPYVDATYIHHFRVLLEACTSNKPLMITYQAPKNEKKSTFCYIPYKLTYSQKDDKFRVLGVLVNDNTNYFRKVTLNISRICDISLTCPDIPDIDFHDVFKYYENKEPILVKVFKQRNSLERFMLQFASWKKETTYHEEEDCYYCKIFYDASEESEILIRVLGFGPTIKVLGPSLFLKQVKERIRKQWELNSTLINS